MCKKDKEYEGFLRVPFQECFKIILRIVVSLAKEVVGTSHQTYIYILFRQHFEIGIARGAEFGK